MNLAAFEPQPAAACIALIQIKCGKSADVSSASSIRNLIIDWRFGLAMQATWYVTYEVHRRGILPRPRCPRQTVTFATEAEARQFARARLEEGLIVFAGTINPHLPKQLIPAERIIHWIALE